VDVGANCFDKQFWRSLGLLEDEWKAHAIDFYRLALLDRSVLNWWWDLILEEIKYDVPRIRADRKARANRFKVVQSPKKISG
jgi:hypothetical protein